MNSSKRREKIILPNFSEDDLRCLKKYHQFNEKYRGQLNLEFREKLADHRVWGPIFSKMTPEQSKAQSERSQKLQREAIFEGKWKEYSEDLLAQGRAYAQMNIDYNDWYELIRLAKHMLVPYIKRDFAESISEAVDVMDGLSKMVDYAMYGIAVAYFLEKNAIIKESDDRFSLIFNASEDVILLISKEGDIIMINHAVRHDAKDLIGKKVYEFQGPENAKKMQDALDTAVNHKKTGNFEVDILVNGETKYYYGKISPVLDEKGEVMSAVVVSRDVTREKQASIDLTQLNATLEQKVAERTEELAAINKELESFTYSVSHDLRAPLRAINGFAEIMKEEAQEGLNEVARDSLDEIISNANKMGVLIDDLLEFSRLGRLPVSKTLVDMNEVFKAVLIETKRASPKNLSVKLNPLRSVYGDYAMLKQVAVNLVSNAVKYSSKKEQPHVEIGSQEKNGQVEFYVKDNGAGFNMEYYDKLFNVFQRLHGAREFEGTGVGLAIVQRIINKHDGKVWAEAKEDNGATFYFSLPLNSN
ncbi:MAG: PAS domain-containing protein [Bacteroidia bacterium]|nr:PAS domain-containing protein [Bacteroidia bacterium]